MSTRNLWGDLPVLDGQKTPVGILREQAVLLTEQTKGVLVGRVDQIADEGFDCDLDIRAPSLNNYSITVLKITHPITLYPLRVFFRLAQTTKDHWECADEAQFIETLGKILGSPEVKKVLGALLLQSK